MTGEGAHSEHMPGVEEPEDDSIHGEQVGAHPRDAAIRRPIRAGKPHDGPASEDMRPPNATVRS